MSDQESIRKKRIGILSALFAKTVENGCSEEEAASAAESASRLMHKWAIEDFEIGDILEKKTFVTRRLVLKYANKWRWELANSIAINTGVLGIHSWRGRGRARTEWISFHGREQPTEAAALLAEFIIGEIERLSSDFGKSSGTGTTGKRRFARGCAERLRQRIRESYNLTADARLPVIMKTMRDEAKEDYGEIGQKRSRDVDEDTAEFLIGFLKGDQIQLRKKDKEIDVEEEDDQNEVSRTSGLLPG